MSESKPVNEGAMGQEARCPYSFEAPDFIVTDERHVEAPFEFYRKLRHEQPVFDSVELGSVVLSRYQDVREGFRDHRRLASKGSLEGAARLAPEVVEMLEAHDATLRNFIANVDQPQHTRLRRSVSKPFSVRSMAKLAPQVRVEAAKLIRELMPLGRADLVKQFSNILPARVTAAFLGIPLEHTGQVHRWVSDWFDLFFTPLPLEEQRKRAEGYIEYVGYMKKLIEERRRKPTEDFMSQVIASINDGTADLNEDELIGLMTSISLGGNDTTGNQIAVLFHRLLTEGNSWERVVKEPDIRDSAIEESIRIDGAGIGGFRVATQDIEVPGGTIPAGVKVFLNQDSADHDETVFQDPETFLVDRVNAGDNIGFGAGIHHCLGAPLARMELRQVLDVMTELLPTLRIGEGAERRFRPSVVQRALLSLPVEWEVP
ncbi:cytochrome P450 [Streptomyces spiralis]|uniref:cytochrome P450 n=1 Tax=Streptomyces spiralis TaxID=66376 RepID=UPI0033CC1E64